jgi:hypothetical protein
MSETAVGAGPLTVWDVRSDPWWDRYRERQRWLDEHGLPAWKMYRVEFWLVDAPFALIFCYALNETGFPRRIPCPGGPHDHPGCGLAREEPRTVPLADFPPRDLW